MLLAADVISECNQIMKKSNYRSALSLAKNLGSAGSGAAHWWYQRFSAIIILLCTWWLFCFSWELSGATRDDLLKIIRNPYNVIMLILFVAAGMYHAVMGMRVVIEDYVHCRAIRITLLLFCQIFSLVSVVSFVVAVFYVMNL